MDEREKKYLEARARPLEKKTVTYKVTPDKNFGLDPSGETTIIAGKCPCSVCGHDSMLDCEENDCKCCTSLCN